MEPTLYIPFIGRNVYDALDALLRGFEFNYYAHELESEHGIEAVAAKEAGRLTEGDDPVAFLTYSEAAAFARAHETPDRPWHIVECTVDDIAEWIENTVMTPVVVLRARDGLGFKRSE